MSTDSDLSPGAIAFMNAKANRLSDVAGAYVPSEQEPVILELADAGLLEVRPVPGHGYTAEFTIAAWAMHAKREPWRRVT